MVVFSYEIDPLAAANKGMRRSYIEVGLIVEKGKPPDVRVLPLGSKKQNPKQKLTIRAEVSSIRPESLVTLWDVFDEEVGGEVLEIAFSLFF